MVMGVVSGYGKIEMIISGAVSIRGWCLLYFMPSQPRIYLKPACMYMFMYMHVSKSGVLGIIEQQHLYHGCMVSCVRCLLLCCSVYFVLRCYNCQCCLLLLRWSRVLQPVRPRAGLQRYCQCHREWQSVPGLERAVSPRPPPHASLPQLP